MFGDVEEALKTWASAVFPNFHACVEMPVSPLANTVQFTRYGGARPVVGFDTAQVDVDCYTPGRVNAKKLAEQIADGLLYKLPGTVWNGLLFLSADTSSTPSWAPYDNTLMRRVTASYSIRTRNPV